MILFLAAHGAHLNPFAMPGLAGVTAQFSFDKLLPAQHDRMPRQRPHPLQLRKPGLFVIGAMKSGTTYLCKLLDAHPEVFMCSPEEPSYFVEPRQLRSIWPDTWDLGFWRSEENYLRLFAAGGDALHLGEASTNYAKLPEVDGVSSRIHAFNPDARFIYLMRDPIERTISHYWHMVRYHAERRPMLEAIKADPQYLDVSHYAMQLMPYLDRFGPDRVAILTFEQLTHDPLTAMRPVYEWLGVDPSLADVSCFAQAENVTPDIVRMATWRGTLQLLRQLQTVRSLLQYLPQGLRRNIVQLASREVDRRTHDTSKVAEFLRPIQTMQTEALVRLVGRQFPEWATLYGNCASPMMFVGHEVMHES